MKSEEHTTLWTVGHSARSLDAFIGLITACGMEAIADVRRFPGSRKHPHFGRDALALSLREAGIEYVPMPELGGMRRPRPDSRNTLLRNESFRGYADYMETEAFRAGMKRLQAFSRLKRTAVMCAEAVWWRCHRSLIADYLKAAGVDVLHIVDSGKVAPHPYTGAARIRDGALSYSPEEGDSGSITASRAPI